MSVYEERHVLFCDILGFSAAILDPAVFPGKFLIALSQLGTAVEEANRPIDGDAIDPEVGRRPNYVVRPRAEHFSDSIVISVPATNVDAIWLCEAAAWLQNSLARLGFLSRGAIVTGSLHHEETTVFGPAFLEAVHWEKASKYPRVYVSPETMRHFRYGKTEEDRRICAIREQQLIVQDKSGFLRIDPYYHLKFFRRHQISQVPKELRELAERWRLTIERALTSKNSKVFDKAAWAARRFNEQLVIKGSWIERIEVPPRPTS